MTSLTELCLYEARDGLKNKSFSTKDLILDHIDAMESSRKLNAFITETPEIALKSADLSDDNYANNTNRPLEGLPLGVKDMFCTKGVLTTASSKMLSNFIPPYESTVTDNLWNNGAILLGKLNNDEFAMGSSNETSFFGSVINPWKKNDKQAELVPGGSSGGSAASVAAKVGVGSLGTDTGGSIRQPASFTGTVGLKPTYGRCSRWGIIAFASSLDQAGPITRNVKDNAILLNSMCSHDPKDTTSSLKEIPNFESSLGKSIKGLKVGIPREFFQDGMSDEIIKMWDNGKEWLKNAGAEIIEISLPNTKYALPCYYIIAPAEASSNLARYDGVRFGHSVSSNDINEMYELTRSDGFGDEVKRRIMIGTYVLSSGYYDAYYLKAQKVRSLISKDYSEAFNKVDVMLTPSTPNSAFELNEKCDDPLSMYLNDVFTVPINIAGLPAISIPSSKDKVGLPLGLQLIGKPFDEETLYSFANIIEESSNFESLDDKWWLK
ncbi:MAG: Asp-tRNA(Asn)/Glu-tRNA(Gln) amidotransferase subunit GatA [Hyphomicrobiales bacterium]|jgi:aspartyl-tRNA(Asn)/glutamyl-tRNA(Gln) amidotransferase subunit A|nr:Asp-tRNA(Asn)/Glu-tRNA(Gln) amidotransferase subunit GatA [Hyphomicrobiales bacterium]MDG1664576.1 Asp-tRNA(Asn)/Glu-tRNA(Gln) amidotransferase subunit GatA [Hyphomicrobiales bacterium]|tara:strand:- start:1202 stop:2680 length:1479 start_codon:yes stop_codon:yes gene_type:complete